LEVASNLCFELSHKFFDVKIMVTLGMVYSLYWICEDIIASNFLPHLVLIKSTFFVDKLKGGSRVPGLLDSRQLDVQASHFSLTMGHNVEAMMWESNDVNPIIHMWLKIQSLPFWSRS
jgi:hypothetical protein